MKTRLIAAVVLVIALVALLVVAGNLKENHHQTLAEYESQCQQLETRAAELALKQAELDDLMAKATKKQEEADSLNQTIQDLENRLQELDNQKEQLLADIGSLEATLNALREEQEEDSDESYYLEVYDALTEGLNKVKGYLAGN